MLSHIVRRVLQSFGVLAVMSLLVFAAVYAVGNPMDILVNPQSDQMRSRAPPPRWPRPAAPRAVLIFIKHASTGDLGRSFAFNVPAIGLILERMPATLELATAAMLIAVLLGNPSRALAGLKPDRSRQDHHGGLDPGFSLPTFLGRAMLIMVFSSGSAGCRRRPRTDHESHRDPVSFLTLEGLCHLALPAANLALFNVSLLIRLTRSGTREALQQDYVRFARAKGLTETRIVASTCSGTCSFPSSRLRAWSSAR